MAAPLIAKPFAAILQLLLKIFKAILRMVLNVKLRDARPIEVGSVSIYRPHGALVGFAVFLACFVGGWALQLVGHAFEGRKPALVHNLAQIFFAPAFLIAEPLFAIGAERELKHAIEARQQDYLAGSPAEREPRR